MSDRHPSTESLNAYLLDELDREARAAVSTHLEGCVACRDAVVRLETTLAAYRDARSAAADEAALGRLLAAPRPRRRERPGWTTAALAAAAAAVIFLGGFWAGRSDVGRPAGGPAQVAPVAAPEAIRHRADRELPAVAFGVADADLLGGPALRDTTWN